MRAVLVPLLLLSLVQLSRPATLSQKKGLALSWDDHRCGDFEVLKGAHWWYDWSAGEFDYVARCHKQPLPGYVPMVWTWHLDGKSNNYHFGSSNVVLGFNEPNQPDQANLSTEQAARYWHQVQRQAGSRKLVSPAIAAWNGQPADPFAYYDRFFNECKDCRFDYLGAHYYTCNVDQMMAYLEKLWNKYHLKIWLTEFSCPSGTSAQRLEFLKKAVHRLEAAHYIARYSWFDTRAPWPQFIPGNLLEPNASRLTELGRFYMNFQTHTSDIVG